MNIFGAACVKNESDIIEAFVRHNLARLDRLLVLDHGSTDGTGAILQALRDEGLALEIIHDAGIGKLQGARMTRLMREAVRQGADWVVPLDGDEFLRPRTGALPRPGPDSPEVLKLAWRTYLPDPADDLSEPDPARRLRRRLAAEPLEHAPLAGRRYFLKSAVSARTAVHPGFQVLQGSHQVLVDGVEPVHALWEGVELAHFPIRSPGQYASKIATHLLQHLARGSTREPFSWFYLSHLEQLRQDFDGFARNFHRLLPAYMETRSHPRDLVEDPLARRGGPLRHTPVLADGQRFTGNLLGYAEALARSHGRLALAEPSDPETEIVLELEHARGSATVRATLHADALRPVVLEIPPWRGPEPLVLAWAGPVSLVHCAGLRLFAGAVLWRSWAGPDILKDWSVRGGLHPVRDGANLAFVKGIDRAELSLDCQGKGECAGVTRVELDLRADSHPASIGLRYFQQNPFEAEARQLEIIRGLEAKVSKLVRVRGFLEHQAGWLAGLLCRRFRR